MLRRAGVVRHSVPACTCHMPSALPCRAASVARRGGTVGTTREPSCRVDGQRVSNGPCSRDASTTYLTPARKREDAGASPGSPSYPQASSRNAKPRWPAPERTRAMVGDTRRPCAQAADIPKLRAQPATLPALSSSAPPTALGAVAVRPAQ